MSTDSTNGGRLRGLWQAAGVAALGLACGAASATAPAGSVLARAELSADGQTLEILERSIEDGAQERSFRSSSGKLLYRSVVKPLADGFEVEVRDGHPSQLGSFQMRGGRLEVRDPGGRLLWAETLEAPLCLPEVFGEFVRAHWTALSAAAAPLRCVTPIIKAEKVAPLQWRRLPDGPGGERVVELGPGSFGMRFFVVATRLTFSPDGTQLLAQQGQFEAPPRIDGRASYLRGKARFTQPRSIAAWAPQRFGMARN